MEMGEKRGGGGGIRFLGLGVAGRREEEDAG